MLCKFDDELNEKTNNKILKILNEKIFKIYLDEEVVSHEIIKNEFNYNLTIRVCIKKDNERCFASIPVLRVKKYIITSVVISNI
jgi:hypothetical protein